MPADRPIPVRRCTLLPPSVSHQVTAGRSEPNKPATPSALPIPSVQPPTRSHPAIEILSNACSIVTSFSVSCHPRIEAIWLPTHRWCNFIQARRGSPERNQPGAMAQLVAHHTGSVGVRGSSPLSSTEIAGQARSETGPDLFFVSDPAFTPRFCSGFCLAWCHLGGGVSRCVDRDCADAAGSKSPCRRHRCRLR